MNNTYIKNIIIALVLILVAIAGYHLIRTQGTAPLANTPVQMDISNWFSFTDPASHVEFKYPEKIGATFITPVDWPPQVRMVDEPFACNEAGAETARAGITAKQTINGTDYCVTKESEGAAGSTYTNYAYAKAHEEKTMIFTFSLKAVQCLNYDEPKNTECTTERNAFTIDPIIDQMMRTATLKALASV